MDIRARRHPQPSQKSRSALHDTSRQRICRWCSHDRELAAPRARAPVAHPPSAAVALEVRVTHHERLLLDLENAVDAVTDALHDCEDANVSMADVTSRTKSLLMWLRIHEEMEKV